MIDQFIRSIEDGTVFDGISEEVWEQADRFVRRRVYRFRLGDKWYDTVINDAGEQVFVGIGPVRALFAHHDKMFEQYGADRFNAFGAMNIAMLAIVQNWPIEVLLEGSILAGKSVAAVVAGAEQHQIPVVNTYEQRAEIDLSSDWVRRLPQGDKKDPQVGDHFAVRVGSKWYDTVIDANSVQRFVVQPVVNAFVDHSHKMFDHYWMERRIADHPAVYGLNEIAVDCARGMWSNEDQIEFYTMFGYSVSGFSGLSWLADVEIENPLWED